MNNDTTNNKGAPATERPQTPRQNCIIIKHINKLTVILDASIFAMLAVLAFQIGRLL